MDHTGPGSFPYNHQPPPPTAPIGIPVFPMYLPHHSANPVHILTPNAVHTSHDQRIFFERFMRFQHQGPFLVPYPTPHGWILIPHQQLETLNNNIRGNDKTSQQIPSYQLPNAYHPWRHPMHQGPPIGNTGPSRHQIVNQSQVAAIGRSDACWYQHPTSRCPGTPDHFRYQDGGMRIQLIPLHDWVPLENGGSNSQGEQIVEQDSSQRLRTRDCRELHLAQSRRHGLGTVLVDRPLSLQELHGSDSVSYWSSFVRPFRFETSKMLQTRRNMDSLWQVSSVIRSMTMANSFDERLLYVAYDEIRSLLQSTPYGFHNIEIETHLRIVLNLITSLCDPKEALRPKTIIWNYDERRKISSMEILEIFWITGLPRTERPRLGVAVCVIDGDKEPKKFVSDHQLSCHAESSMIDYLRRVLMTERRQEKENGRVWKIEVFQNYSPCGECGFKYRRLLFDFAKNGLCVKVTIHFVSVYRIYWEVTHPTQTFDWLTLETHCANRDGLVSLMQYGVELLTFDFGPWLKLVQGLGIEIKPRLFRAYVENGRQVTDRNTADFFNRIREYALAQQILAITEVNPEGTENDICSKGLIAY